MGSDPDLFRPHPEIAKDIDVSFIGARYGIRRQIVDYLQRSGVRVEGWGRDWGNGHLPLERVPEIVARSRICLGVATIGHTWSLTSPKLRDYDMPMAGAFYLTQHSRDVVEHLVPSVEIETYRSFEECARKARFYLDHPEWAEAIGRAGRERCLRDHTWEARFAKMLRTVGLLA
jgi:spore maturation protein CgeB